MIARARSLFLLSPPPSLFQDLDRGNDGVPDARDACARGRLGFLSSAATDFDGDGCEDSLEDGDDDGDGVLDLDDECARTAGEEVGDLG